MSGGCTRRQTGVETNHEKHESHEKVFRGLAEVLMAEIIYKDESYAVMRACFAV